MVQNFHPPDYLAVSPILFKELIIGMISSTDVESEKFNFFIGNVLGHNIFVVLQITNQLSNK